MPLNSAASEHREQQRDVGVQQQIAGGVGAQAVGRGVAEREQPRVAHHQVEAHGEQAEDQRLGQQRHGERRQAGGGERQRAAPRLPDQAEPVIAITLPCRAGRRDAPPAPVSMTRYMQRQRQIGEVVGAEHLHERDQQRADQRAGEAAHAADDDDDERVDDGVRRHAERRGDQRCRQHAADAGQPAADAEHAGAHQAHVGAERVHHLGVLRGGADQQAEPRALQELPDRDARPRCRRRRGTGGRSGTVRRG